MRKHLWIIIASFVALAVFRSWQNRYDHAAYLMAWAIFAETYPWSRHRGASGANVDTAMSIGDKDAILRERVAFCAGYRYVENRAAISLSNEPEGMAAKRYPLPQEQAS